MLDMGTAGHLCPLSALSLRTLFIATMLFATVLVVLAAPARADSPARLAMSTEHVSAEQKLEIARLEALGYAATEPALPVPPGVNVYDETRAYEGVNFFVSGHGTDALLVDMEGKVLHRWSKRFDQLWPRRSVLLRDSKSSAHYFRRGYPQPNGDLIVIFEGLGVARLDWSSNILWKRSIRAHHDLRLLPDGEIAILTRKAGLVTAIDQTRPVLDDFITILASNGKVKKRVSVLEAFRASDYAWMLEHRPIRTGDILHTNALEILDGRATARNAAFTAGRALISIRELGVIAVLDLDRGVIVWALQGGFRRQHDARIVEPGHVLLFDNGGLGLESRVVELDPYDGRVVWSYRGEEGKPFYSDCCGTARRLPNGNTLFTETSGGRACEVTRNGDIVWEFHNPFRIPLSDTDPTTASALLFDLIRLPSDFGSQWISAARH
jgi:hypothetical protein